MRSFEDCYWLSEDGLRLHFRDYAAADTSRPPILCLPGLTRNARDFANLADSLPEWRVICPDMRGRGDSAYARNWATYQPLQYVNDVFALLDQFAIPGVVVIGTSLGGVMAKLMAMIEPGRVLAAVLNDIGPVIEAEGLAKILEYVGQGRNFPTWMHAARALEETHGPAFPDFSLEDWLGMAKRVMTLGSNGRIVFDYDMKIAAPFEAAKGNPSADLWPGFAALAARPLLMIRGGLSNLLSAETFAEMGARAPGAESLTLANVGHAPTLDEPEARAAIVRLLARVTTGTVAA